MIPILLSISSSPATATTGYLGACTYAEIDQGGWLGINFVVILLALVVGAAIYAFASLLNTSTRERLRGAVKVELFSAIISVFIILILLGFAYTACQIGQSLTSELTIGQYQDPMQFAQYYLGNLLFERAEQIFGQMYAESALFVIYGHIAEWIIESIEAVLFSGFTSVQLGTNITGVYYGYAGVLTGTYMAMLVASFAVLFIFYILLPIVQALALTVLLPLTIVIRSWPFGGPRLREAANSFLGIAIAFYFVLPLSITLNNYVINWMYCGSYVGTGTPLQLTTQDCNPYVSYISFTQFTTLPLNSLFASSTLDLSKFGGGPVQAPVDFFLGTVSGQGGIISILSGALSTLFKLPGVVTSYGYEIAEFMFESIVLIALDIAITIGFAQGLSKGLNAIPNVLAGGQAGGTVFGPFWGNV